jgi:MFS family permease
MSVIPMVPIMPEIFRAYGSVPHANFWIPALMTIPGFCTALLSPIAGYIGDRAGSKWLIAACLVAYVLFGVAPLMIQDFHTIIATRIGVGIAQTGVLVISIAMISQQFHGAMRERWLALQAGAAIGSTVILLPLSGFLASSDIGWRGSFLLFLMGIPLAIFLIAQRVRPAASETQDDSISQTIPWRWLLGQCVITCLTGVIFFSTQFQLGLALSTLGISDTATIGMLSALAAAGVVIGTILFMPVKRLLGTALLPCELLLSGVGLLVIWQFQTVPVFVVFAFITMIACGMMLPTLITVVAAGLPNAVRGRGLGLWNSAFTLAQFIGSAFIGAVLAQPGWTVLDAFGILGLGAIGLSLLLGIMPSVSGGGRSVATGALAD